MTTLISDAVAASDIPDAAYANTLRAIEAFNVTTTEYGFLLDSQRALLEERNFTAIEMMLYRGDRLARDARAYGQQLSSFRRAMLVQGYQGPKTEELYYRIGTAERQAYEIGQQAAQLMALCSAAQRIVSLQLEEPATALDPKNRYMVGQPPAILFDTVR